MNIKYCFICIVFFLIVKIPIGYAQDTKIGGFVHVSTKYVDDKLSFSLGEQDLFITSNVTDKLSFLGESVFKYSGGKPALGIERIILKYNYAGNHSFLIGKHHTPVNYWNDNYHHGRVFFPTIFRPYLFSAGIIPIHTTGLGVQGQNLSDIRFGYDILIGNGIGSTDREDNDQAKSLTIATHIKPIDGMRIGLSAYFDKIGEGASRPLGAGATTEEITHTLVTGSFAYFGNRFEVLTEASFGMNKTNNIDTQNSLIYYAYIGAKLGSFVPYLRYDNLSFDDLEMYYNPDDMSSFVLGIRYELSYLAAIKVEYQYQDFNSTGSVSSFNTQFAIGF